MTQTVVLDDPKDLQKVYDGITKDFEQIDYGDYLKLELDYIATLHKSYFDSSTGPDGQAWQANAPRTIKQKGHSTILRGVRGRRERNVKVTKRRPAVRFARGRWLSGYRLSTSLTAKTTQSFGDAIREAVEMQDGGALTFGTSVEYSIYNQEGTSRIPARPHVGFTNEYIDKAVQRAADYTVQQLAK